MKVAILGVWHVHAKDYTKVALEKGEVVGFFERDDALAEEFKGMFGLKRFDTVEELLASDAEGVIVCSATCDHAEDIIKAAQAKKDIFTEKVLALTSEECDAIEKAVEENGVSFTISMFQKFVGAWMSVKSIVDSGELGKINYVRVRNCHSGSVSDWLPKHFYNARECGGGAMIDLGAHGMYLIEWLLGVPESASSAFTIACERAEIKEKNSDGVEDNAVTVMSYKSGAIAVNETGFVSGIGGMFFEVHGERGYVRADSRRVIKCTRDTSGAVTDVEMMPSQPFPIAQFMSGTVQEGCSMKEAKALTRMMELAYNR